MVKNVNERQIIVREKLGFRLINPRFGVSMQPSQCGWHNIQHIWGKNVTFEPPMISFWTLLRTIWHSWNGFCLWLSQIFPNQLISENTLIFPFCQGDISWTGLVQPVYMNKTNIGISTSLCQTQYEMQNFKLVLVLLNLYWSSVFFLNEGKVLIIWYLYNNSLTFDVRGGGSEPNVIGQFCQSLNC